MYILRQRAINTQIKLNIKRLVHDHVFEILSKQAVTTMITIMNEIHPYFIISCPIKDSVRPTNMPESSLALKRATALLEVLNFS